MDTETIEEEAKRRWLTDAEFAAVVNHSVNISIPKELKSFKMLYDPLKEQAIHSACLALVIKEKLFPVEVTYDRDVLVDILVYHYRNDHASCGCGWAELGKSHPEHVANIYEMSMKALND